MTQMQTALVDIDDFGQECETLSHGSVPTLKKIWVPQDIFDELQAGKQILSIKSGTHSNVPSLNLLIGTKLEIDVCVYPSHVGYPLHIVDIVSHSLWMIGGLSGLIPTVIKNTAAHSTDSKSCDCTLSNAHETWCHKWQAYTAD